ncbi:kelch-like protein 41 [Arctopsyche grandis]|uniref:kelch-like protein 41 n=1 Tax=Arctopsyche grandis TaxID=121162 RepID=UPI00406D9CEC
MIEVKAKPGFATKRLEHLYDAMRNEKHVDLFFIVRNKSFYAHMIVLSACSEFFTKNMYKLSETFSDFEYPIIEAMLKYCYTGKINIDDKDYGKFIELADKLEIKNIAPRYKTIDQKNCLEVLSLSDDPTSRAKAMKLTIDKFKTLHKTPKFLKLPASALAEILKSDKLNASVNDVFNSVKLWVNSDEMNRRSELAELMTFVKLTLLSTEFVVTEFVDFCLSYPECNEILQQTLQSILPNCQRSIQIESDVTMNVKIAFVGSENTSIDTANTIDIYNDRNKCWSLSRNFRFDRTNFQSVLVDDDWMMIIGGLTSKAVTLVDYVDLKTGQKHPLKPLNQARYHFSAVTVRRVSSTDVYAIGGYNSNVLSSMERWNSKTQNWDTSVAPLLLAVYWPSASVIDGRIYLTGGELNNNGLWKSVDEVQMYSVESNCWSYRAPMIQRRHAHSSIAVSGKLFVAGGYVRDTATRLDSVESYSPDANLWTAYCKLPNPTYGISLCLFRNVLLCMGGEDENGIASNVWEYDDLNKTWKTFKSLSKGRSVANALVIPHDSII